MRNGIFSDIELIRLKYPEVNIYYYNTQKSYASIVAKIDSVLYDEDNIDEEVIFDYIHANTGKLRSRFDLIIDSNRDEPATLISSFSTKIIEDTPFAIEKKSLTALSNIANGVYIIGSKSDVHVHSSVKIQPGVIFDTTNGPILIDMETQIGQFSFIQ